MSCLHLIANASAIVSPAFARTPLGRKRLIEVKIGGCVCESEDHHRFLRVWVKSYICPNEERSTPQLPTESRIEHVVGRGQRAKLVAADLLCNVSEDLARETTALKPPCGRDRF